LLFPDHIIENARTLRKKVQEAVAEWDQFQNPNPTIALLRKHCIVLADDSILEVLKSWYLAGRFDLLESSRFTPHERRDLDHIHQQKLCLAIKDMVDDLVKAGLTKQAAMQAVADDPKGIGFSRTDSFHLSAKQIEKYYYRTVQYDYYFRLSGNELIFRVEPAKIVLNGLRIYGWWEYKASPSP
jgi:hypothetical protein